MSEQNKKYINYEGPADFSLEIALKQIERLLEAGYIVSKRAIALLLLCEDKEVMGLVTSREPSAIHEIKKIITEAKTYYNKPLSFVITMRRQQEAANIVQRTTRLHEGEKISFQDMLSNWMISPLTGIPVLCLVLYFGLYKFVAGFGAGVLVDFLEGVIFDKYINPCMIKFVSMLTPWPVFNNLFIGEYGIITLGVRYSIGIILPIVSIFFLYFAVIEDSGYLPRLAMMLDNIFKKIGLSGRAVIPMVLGFGCATMATMVTRTLPTKRERLIATLLLALAVPCSAQLGVILGLLGANPRALLVWGAVILFVFTFVGYISAKILPGEKPSFYMEIPPLRLPKLSNVLRKTYVRVKWYLKEVLPLFVMVSVIIWAGQITKLFDALIWVLKGPVKAIGLPAESAAIFLLGFFRRDYGAAGLYDLNKAGMLSGTQLVIACVTLTLFLPCVAQFIINIKERGPKTGLFISLFVMLVAFGVAYILNTLFSIFGIAI